MAAGASRGAVKPLIAVLRGEAPASITASSVAGCLAALAREEGTDCRSSSLVPRSCDAEFLPREEGRMEDGGEGGGDEPRRWHPFP